MFIVTVYSKEIWMILLSSKYSLQARVTINNELSTYHWKYPESFDMSTNFYYIFKMYWFASDWKFQLKTGHFLQKIWEVRIYNQWKLIYMFINI